MLVAPGSQLRASDIPEFGSDGMYKRRSRALSPVESLRIEDIMSRMGIMTTDSRTLNRFRPRSVSSECDNVPGFERVLTQESAGGAAILRSVHATTPCMHFAVFIPYFS